MIDAISKLLEACISLLREDKKDSIEYFERYAKPAFDLSQAVFKDYMKSLSSVRQRVEDGESRTSLLRFLEESRVEYLPVRMQLRAMLHRNTGRLHSGHLGQFEHGVFGLLHGGLVHMEETSRARHSGLYFHGHTLLDILFAVSHNTDDVPTNNLLKLIQEQEQSIQGAFRDVTLGYEALRQATLPSGAASKALRHVESLHDNK